MVRRIWFVVISVGLAASVSCAQPADDSKSLQGRLYLELGTGIDVPVWGNDIIQQEYKAAVGYYFDENQAAQLKVVSSFSNSNGISLTETKIIPEVKLLEYPDVVRPYVLLGAGVVNFTYSPDSLYPNTGTLSFWYFDVVFGGGVDAPLDGETSLFIEAKFNQIYVPDQITRDIPITAGMNFNL